MPCITLSSGKSVCYGDQMNVPSFADGGSVVDYLKSRNLPSDKTSRGMMAKQLGIKNYDYSENANIALLAALKQKEASDSVSRNMRPGAPHPSIPRQTAPAPRPVTPRPAAPAPRPMFDYRSDPRFAMTPVVAGGELPNQAASRNAAARVAATTPKAPPVSKRYYGPGEEIPEGEGRMGVGYDPGLDDISVADQLQGMYDGVGDYLSELGGNAYIAYNDLVSGFNNAVDTGIGAVSGAIDNVLGVIPGSNKLSDTELKNKFIKDNGLSISANNVYVTKDADGNRTLRLFNPNSTQFKNTTSIFNEADKNPKSIVDRANEFGVFKQDVINNPESHYCIKTATGLLCQQGTMDPRIKTNDNSYWNPGMKSIAERGKFGLDYSEGFNPMAFTGTPDQILQFAGNPLTPGVPTHATAVGDVYFNEDNLTSPRVVTYQNPGASAKGVVKKTYSIGDQPRLGNLFGLLNDADKDITNEDLGTIRSNYRKKEFGGMNTYRPGGKTTVNKKYIEKQNGVITRVDLKEAFGLDPFSKAGLAKARELQEKQDKAIEFCVEGSGCSQLAVNAANAVRDNDNTWWNSFDRGHAWLLADNNSVDKVFPPYNEDMLDKNQMLSNSVFLNSRNNYPSQISNLSNYQDRLILLDRLNDTSEFNSKGELNPSFQSAEGSGNEHAGYMLDKKYLLHGTGGHDSNKEDDVEFRKNHFGHNAFFILDNVQDKQIKLPGKRYVPVAAIND